MSILGFSISMELPPEIDTYIKESIDDFLGLPVTKEILELKLLASQESLRRLSNQYSLLLSKVKEKDQIIDRARVEASLNAKAVKRFVEENQWLAEECRRLLSECSLYEQDREALMEFRDEADERAKEAEIHNLEVQLGQVLDDLNFYKHQYQTLGTNKLKSSPRMSSPIEKKIDFDLDPATREPLSPLQYNSPDSRMHKK